MVQSPPSRLDTGSKFRCRAAKGLDPIFALEQKNWSRWGSADRRGLLNLVSAEKTRSAAQLAHSGRAFTLAIPMSPEYSSPLRGVFEHRVSVRHDDGPSRRTGVGGSIATDLHNFTHIDALGHVQYDGFSFNGVPTTDRPPWDAGTVDQIGVIATRAVVLDVARACGVESLEAGFVIEPKHLDASLHSNGTTVEPGDALLVRTGWIQRYLQSPETADSGWPGLGQACIEWLSEKDVVAVGADTVGVEVVPPEDPGGYLVLHEQLIRDLGMHLLEFLTLEECCVHGVTEGLFVAAPLPIRNGFGSPLVPVLIT